MELLLNLVWIALAASAFMIFPRRSSSSQGSWLSERRSLLALACLLLLLFPIVSASDDLHPSQLLLEDATKRIQSMASPVHFSGTASPIAATPALAILLLLPCLSLGTRRTFVPFTVPTSDGHLTSSEGRGPPFLLG